MNTPSTGPGQVQVYRQGHTRRTLGALFLAGLIALGCWYVVPVLIPDRYSDTVDRNATIAAATVLILALWIGMFWWSNTRVQVGPDFVEVWRPGKLVHRWSRHDTQFSSQITRHSTNGVPSGSVRALQAHNQHGTQEVALGGMSRKNFNELYALISLPVGQTAAASYQPQGWAGAPSQPPGLTHPIVFTTQPTALASRARLIWALAALFTLVGTGALVMIFGYGRLESPYIWATGALFIGVILAIIGIAGITQERSRPHQVVVAPDALIIGDDRHDFAGLERIWLTPASYAKRELRVVGPGGRKRSYSFGNGTVRPDRQVLPEWDGLIDTLKQATAQRPGMVALDLG